MHQYSVNISHHPRHATPRASRGARVEMKSRVCRYWQQYTKKYFNRKCKTVIDWLHLIFGIESIESSLVLTSHIKNQQMDSKLKYISCCIEIGLKSSIMRRFQRKQDWIECKSVKFNKCPLLNSNVRTYKHGSNSTHSVYMVWWSNSKCYWGPGVYSWREVIQECVSYKRKH